MVKIELLFKRIAPKLKALAKTRHFKLGGPLFAVTAITLCMVMLNQEIRYEFRKSRTLTDEELKAYGIESPKKTITLEEEYKIMKIDEDKEWKNIRIPREEEISQ